VTLRIQLPSWTCPSGNSVDVFFRYDAGVERLDLEWDNPPPLPPDDEAYYTAVILPAIAQSVAEMQEHPAGQALMAQARAAV